MPRKYYVYVLNHPPCRAIALEGDFKFPDFVAAVGLEVKRDVEGVEFRWVDKEPDADNAVQLFTDFNLRPIKNTSSLSNDGVVYIVGKLSERPAAGAAGGAAGGFDADVALLEGVLRSNLSAAQRQAYKHRYFNETRSAIRDGRFDTKRESVRNLVSVLNGFVHTATRRRLSTLAGGIYLDGLIKGCDTRGRPADLFYAVNVADGVIGAAKIFYKPLPHEEPLPVPADHEWNISRQLDAAATGELAAFRHHVVRYSAPVDLNNGRLALFMPAYTRSFHDLVQESHVSVPLPEPFLLRTARDVLRGLALLHHARLAHCDVKADNIMYSGEGTATLIDLGAVTEFGEPVVEGMPEEMALGLNAKVSDPAVDRTGLAVTLWWGLHRTFPSGGPTPESLAHRAEELAAADEAGAPIALRCVAAILRAESTAAALVAVEAMLPR